MKQLFTISLLSGLVCFSSCEIINPEEPVPAYIEIPAISITSDYSLQGSSSAKITDAWIFVDDDLVGAFELPCRIPALYADSHRISIGAGVKLNGISSTRSTYPFYKTYDIKANFERGKTLVLNPVCSYVDSMTFTLLANFDDLSGNKLEAATGSDTTAALTSMPSEVFEGNGSFKATLLRDSGFVAFQMVDPVELPQDGHLVYLEMDYNISHEMVVGAFATFSTGTATNDLLTLSKTDGWNKIYINLTQMTSTAMTAQNFRVYFTSYKPPGSETLKILIDNLKIVH